MHSTKIGSIIKTSSPFSVATLFTLGTGSVITLIVLAALTLQGRVTQPVFNYTLIGLSGGSSLFFSAGLITGLPLGLADSNNAREKKTIGLVIGTLALISLMVGALFVILGSLSARGMLSAQALAKGTLGVYGLLPAAFLIIPCIACAGLIGLAISHFTKPKISN